MKVPRIMLRKCSDATYFHKAAAHVFAVVMDTSEPMTKKALIALTNDSQSHACKMIDITKLMGKTPTRS